MKEYIVWKERNKKLLAELYQEYKEQLTIDFDTFCRKLNTNVPISTTTQGTFITLIKRNPST